MKTNMKKFVVDAAVVAEGVRRRVEVLLEERSWMRVFERRVQVAVVQRVCVDVKAERKMKAVLLVEKRFCCLLMKQFLCVL